MSVGVFLNQAHAGPKLQLFFFSFEQGGRLIILSGRECFTPDPDHYFPCPCLPSFELDPVGDFSILTAHLSTNLVRTCALRNCAPGPRRSRREREILSTGQESWIAVYRAVFPAFKAVCTGAVTKMAKGQKTERD